MNKTLVCSKCFKEKEIVLFVKNNLTKSGYTSTCKDCFNKIRAERNKNVSYPPWNEKECFTCKKLLSKDKFYLHDLNYTGLSSNCKECTREASRLNRIKRGDRDKLLRRKLGLRIQRNTMLKKETTYSDTLKKV